MNVYVLDIAPLRGREREALALLPEERREKALRIRREEARLRSIGASLLLRAAGIEPPFACGEHGKPYIPGGPHFSLTHSGTLAALSVSDTPVGLDIEKIAPVRRAAARALTIEERDYMKAGAGLSQPMNAFSVLGDTASPEGALLSLYTVEYGNYMLSAAAARSAVFTPQRVDALELL